MTPAKIISPAGGSIQTDRALSLGNAMSLAPIMIGRM